MAARRRLRSGYPDARWARQRPRRSTREVDRFAGIDPRPAPDRDDPVPDSFSTAARKRTISTSSSSRSCSTPSFGRAFADLGGAFGSCLDACCRRSTASLGRAKCAATRGRRVAASMTDRVAVLEVEPRGPVDRRRCPVERRAGRDGGCCAVRRRSGRAWARTRSARVRREACGCSDRPPASLGFEDCVVFLQPGSKVRLGENPTTVVDLSSGVICVPSNYPRRTARGSTSFAPLTWPTTSLVWFDEPTYRAEKEKWADEAIATEIARLRPSNLATPRRVSRRVYAPDGQALHQPRERARCTGRPHKVKSGRTDLSNLFLCGTDQGLVGVVGAMLSGINMANLHVLAEGRPR